MTVSLNMLKSQIDCLVQLEHKILKFSRTSSTILVAFIQARVISNPTMDDLIGNLGPLLM